MQKTRRRDVEESFIVKYEDGSIAKVWISIGMQMTRESVMSIVERRQVAGNVPQGKVIAVLPARDRAELPQYGDLKVDGKS